MSKYKLPAVKDALKVLRSNGGGPLTMDEVAALEACAASQAELLEVMRDCADWLCEAPEHTDQWERGQRARAAIAKAGDRVASPRPKGGRGTFCTRSSSKTEKTRMDYKEFEGRFCSFEKDAPSLLAEARRARASEAELRLELDRVTAQEEETAKAFEVLMHDMAEERDAALAQVKRIAELANRLSLPEAFMSELAALTATEENP